MKHLKNELEATSPTLLSVPYRLSNPHPLIATAKVDIQERLKRWRINGWSTDQINTSRGNIDITVSLSQVNRTLRFMDAIIKLLLSRGHKIEVRDKYTFVIVYE